MEQDLQKEEMYGLSWTHQCCTAPADLLVDSCRIVHVDWSADLLVDLCVDLNVDLYVELAASPIEDLVIESLLMSITASYAGCCMKVCLCLFLQHQPQLCQKVYLCF